MVGPKVSPRRYPCDICGRLWTAEEMVYSRHREVRYCPVAQWGKCVSPEDREVPEEVAA